MGAKDPAGRLCHWEGASNTRDLGGMPLSGGGITRSGRVIRTGHLDSLTSSGTRAVLTMNPVRVIDMRSDVERAPASAAQQLPGYRWIPFVDPLTDHLRRPTAERDRADLYRGSLDRNGRQIVAILTEIADAVPGLVVVHCVSGVDRTGMLVALLLDLVGVDRSETLVDYAASAWTSSRPPNPGGAGRVTDQPLDPGVLATVFAHLDITYGGVEAYLLRHGLAEPAIQAIRDRLLV